MSTPSQRSDQSTNHPAGEAYVTPLDLNVRIKLSIMMFLQYFTWGTFFVTLGTYLSSLEFSNQRIGLVYGTSALGAIIAPFFVGMIADRFFATQKILFALHFIGAALLLIVAQITAFSTFYMVMLLYFICYMPTLALTNSLSFSAMSSPEKQFPGIRVLGTIGWIAAGIFVGLMKWEAHNTALIAGAISSFVLAWYCLLLPNTPPANAGKKISVSDILGLDALSLMRQWSFLVFVIGSFLICIPLQFYYGFTNKFLNEIGVSHAAAKMTIGQTSEIFFMLVMPLFFVRLGVKWMLVVGMACWAIRYVLFAFGNATDAMWMLYIGIALHGICYDFFFVTGFIYVDKKAPQAIRASAQGFLTLVTLGIGGFIGTWLAGLTADAFANDGVVDWKSFWLVPAAAAVVVMIGFALTFFDRVDADPTASGD